MINGAALEWMGKRYGRMESQVNQSMGLYVCRTPRPPTSHKEVQILTEYQPRGGGKISHHWSSDIENCQMLTHSKLFEIGLVKLFIVGWAKLFEIGSLKICELGLAPALKIPELGLAEKVPRLGLASICR